MEIVMRRVSELIPYGKNAKKHDETQVANVANSIKRFGWQQPIVVDERDVVVIGHCRLLAAKKLGLLAEDIEGLDFEGFDLVFPASLDTGDIDKIFEDAEEKPKEPKRIQCPHCGEWFEP